MTRWISFIRRRTWPPPVNELYREQEKMKQNEVMKMLYDVQHPAKGDRNIVELGMVDKVEIEGNKVTVTLAFPKHRDPLAEYLIGSTKAALIRHIPGVEAEVRTIVREESARKPAGLDLGLEELAGVTLCNSCSNRDHRIAHHCNDFERVGYVCLRNTGKSFLCYLFFLLHGVVHKAAAYLCRISKCPQNTESRCGSARQAFPEHQHVTGLGEVLPGFHSPLVEFPCIGYCVSIPGVPADLSSDIQIGDGYLRLNSCCDH